MYKACVRRSTSSERLMCRWFGHRMTDGLRYHGATKRGYSSVCQRCGVYEVVEETIDCQSPPKHSNVYHLNIGNGLKGFLQTCSADNSTKR